MAAAPNARDSAFGPTLAFTVSLALAAVALLTCAVTLIVDPQPIPGLDATQRQDAESGLYLVALMVVVPLSVLVGPRLAAAVTRGPNRTGLSALAAVSTAALAAVLLIARAIDELAGAGDVVLLAGTLLWIVAALAGFARARADHEWSRLLAAAQRVRPLWLAAAVLVAATPLVVTHAASVDVPVLAIGAVATGLSLRRSVPALSGWAGRAVDLAMLALLLVVIPDLVVIRPEDPNLSSLDRYLASIMQFHHNFLVGPANQVLGGDTLLRDTASQYGVGSIYLLTGWFELMTVSYGSFALLDGLLTAVLFAAAYGVLRAAGCSRVVAGSTMAVAVAALVFNRIYAVGMLPQEGPFRFGLPMGVIVTAVGAVRWPSRVRLARGAGLFVIGVSAIWALEAFAATVVVFGALAGVEAYLRPAGARTRVLVTRAVQVALATLVAHLLFAAATLAGTGHLPDWSQYFAFLHEFLFGGLGDLTYDFSRWSPGLALGAAYLGSTVALLLVLMLRPALAAERRVAFTALAGVTAYGLVQFWYLVDRSADHVVVYVALPAAMAAALWLSVVLALEGPGSRDVRLAAVAIAGMLGALVLSVSWSSIDRPLSRSAASQLLPGGDSPRAAVARLRAFPAIDPRAPEAERLLDTTMPGERRSVVIVQPDLAVEVLIRRQRANALPISSAREDDFTFDERVPGIRRSVRRLEGGRRMLIDAGALATLRAIRRDPRSRVLTTGDGNVAAVQAQALRSIDRRFRLRLVRRGSGGLAVLELRRRTGG